VVRRADDLKFALTLSACFALAAAATVPLLLPSLPTDARSLPLSLPAFCAVLAVQAVVVYGAIAYAGLRLARAAGLEPTADPTWSPVAAAFATGLACGTLLVAAVAAIQRLLPGTLPRVIHPPGMAAALVASAAGSLGEEILFRLFVLSLALRLLGRSGARTAAAIAISALAFGVAHAPACVFLFGGWREVPPVSWVWVIVLNGFLGAAFGAVFLRRGIVCAVLAHLGTDVVWHAASQLHRA
jgi:hypothetical protein